MALHELLRTMRKKALLSQEDFAKELRVSVGTINRWGKRKNQAQYYSNEENQSILRGKGNPF